jgi:hypothetical protein
MTNWLISILICVADWGLSFLVAEHYQLDMRDVVFWFNAIAFNILSIILLVIFRSSASIGLILSMYICALFHVLCGTMILSYDSLSFYNQNLLHDFILFDREAILTSICVLQMSVFIVTGSDGSRHNHDHDDNSVSSNHF